MGVRDVPSLHNDAVDQAVDADAFHLDPFPRGRYSHELGAGVGAGYGKPVDHPVTLGDLVMDLPVNVGEGGAEVN